MNKTTTVLVLTVSRALTSVVVLLIAVVLSRLLNKAEYATYQQAFLLYTIAMPIMVLGLPNALLYFIPLEPENTRQIVADNLLALALAGTVFLGICWCGGGHIAAIAFGNEDLVFIVGLFGFYGLAMFVASSVPAAMIALKRAPQLGLYQPVSRMALLAFVATFTLVSSTAYTAAIGTVFGALLASVWGVLLVWRNLPPARANFSKRGYWKRLASQLRYSTPLAIGALLDVLMLATDKIVVAVMASATSYAVYVNGAFEVPLIAIITSQAAAVIQPDIGLFAAGRGADPLPAFRRAASLTALVIFPATALLFIAAEDVVVLLFSERYAESSSIFTVYLLILPFRIILFGPVFAAFGKGRLVVVRAAIGLALNAIISVPLVIFMGPVGAAWSTVLVMVAFVFPFCWVVTRRLFDCPASHLVDIGLLSYLALASILSAIFGWLARDLLFTLSGSILSLCVTGAAFALTFCVCLWVIPSLRALTAQLFNTIRFRSQS